MNYSMFGIEKTVMLSALMMALTGCLNPKPQVFSTVDVLFDDKHLTLELADTDPKRQQGLMYRESLCQDCGMVFVYEQPRQVTYWMKDTFMPLDLAYISEDGLVVQVESLTPNSLEGKTTKQAIKYVVEMNQGWFAENHISVGSRFSFIPDVERKKEKTGVASPEK